MKAKGTITSWDDDKGYGFISSAGRNDRVFVHIKAFRDRSRRPVVGDVVTYVPSEDDRGRLQASDAVIAGVGSGSDKKSSMTIWPYVAAGLFLLMVALTVWLTAMPPLILYGYLGLSLLTATVYAYDKWAAKDGGWRISEGKLHLLSLMGGWPGALIAQASLRHKTRKQPFRMIFWLTVGVNCTAFFLLFTPRGRHILQQLLPGGGLFG